MKKSILTVQDVAGEFGLHPLTVSRLAREGVLPGFKIGGSWRFRRDVLEEWMINRTQVARLQRKAEKPARPHPDGADGAPGSGVAADPDGQERGPRDKPGRRAA